jgi:ABC-type bacteriocin/lantibiotic exporter with double-glycine peptidase domain
MKTQESWDFANRYSGKLMVRAGWITLAVSLVVMLLVMFRSEAVVSAVSVVLIFCQLIPLLAVLPLVERQLKKRFDEDGNPREETV